MHDAERFRRQRVEAWTRVAASRKRSRFFSAGYHDRLNQVFRLNVPAGSRVLEVGCGEGDLLAALAPAEGLGVDFCPAFIDRARARHPALEFRCLDAHELASLQGQFDYIILSDLVNDVYDVEEVLRQVARLCTRDTRVLMNFYSHLWSGVLKLAQRLQLANRLLEQNWLTLPDFDNLLHIAGFEPVRHSEEIVLPARIPWLAQCANRVVPRIWPCSHLALTHFVVARLADAPPPDLDSVSIVVAARNEAGHIERLVREVPALGRRTEVIFVEGGSTDDTRAEIERHMHDRADLEISLYLQPGEGKADAVRLGFSKARHDILMVLDADMSVLPGDLHRFHRALASGKGEFINGVRLVYPMQDRAMRFFNLVANKLFSLGFRYALGQPVKDTLCGTKALSRANWLRLERNRPEYGDFDPYGDFDLLFGAARLNLKIVDIPVRYQARSYGETNIRRWSGGILLLRLLFIGLLKIRFA